MSAHSGPDIITDGLVLHLDAADIKSYNGSGTTWYDRSGNENHGTLVNGPTYSSANGGSIVFDGVNDYVDIGDSSSFFSSGSISHNISINIWIKIQSNVNNSIFFGHQNVSNERLYLGNYNQKWDFGWGNLLWGSGATGNLQTSSTSWTNICLNIQNGTAKLYINGQETITKVDTAVNLQGIIPISGYFFNNLQNTQYQIPSSISSTQIYNRALSPAEILQNYKATKSRFQL